MTKKDIMYLTNKELIDAHEVACYRYQFKPTKKNAKEIDMTAEEILRRLESGVRK